MTTFSEMLLLLFDQFTIGETTETTDFVELRAICSGPIANFPESVAELFQTAKYIDHWQITIEDGDEPFTYDNTLPEHASRFVRKWEEFLAETDRDDECNVTITITKKIHGNNIVFVYDHDVFMAYLSRLKVMECIRVMSQLLKRCKGLVLFVVNGLTNVIATDTIHFLPALPSPDGTPKSIADHTKSWDRLKSVCHFSGIEDCIALPSDFKIVTQGDLSRDLTDKFNRCCLVMVLAIFFDFLTIKDNMLTGKLNGYKTFNVSFDISNLNVACLNTYNNIYDWLSTGGNLQDKIGIVRNIISLNIDPADNHTIPEPVYQSILSGFKVYERQNIKQYIELRNKMSDQIIGFNEKAGKIVDAFAGSFQKSALAVISLYATIIVTRVFSSQKLESAFTMEVTILSLVFLLFSLVYFFISRGEASQQKNRYVESYQNMKKRNEDLLTKEDILKILNDDREYKADIKFIKDKMKIYSIFWIFILSVLAFVTLLLFTIHQVNYK